MSDMEPVAAEGLLGGDDQDVPPEPTMLPRKSAAEILAHVDLPEGEIDVEAWGCSLLVRAIPKGVARRLKKEAREWSDAHPGEDSDDFYERLLFKSCVVEPVFTEAELDVLFEEKNATVIEQIIAAIGEVLAGGEDVRTRQIRFRP